VKYIFIIFIGFIFIACSSKNTINKPYSKQQQTTINLPLWIQNPQNKNKICAIGSSKQQNNMKQIAQLKAKANISKNISLYIHSQSIKKKQYHSNTMQQSTNMLKNIQINNEYLDKQNNIYYLQMCIDKSKGIK